MKALPPNLPIELEAFFHLYWEPATGLEPKGIRVLMDRRDLTREQVAIEVGVQPHYVDHVITRVRRSDMVEGTIARHLSPLGLAREHIWGLDTPHRKPARKDLPPELEGVVAFTGRVIKGQHLIGLIVDCETTGLSPEKHALIELGIISFVYRQGEPEQRTVLGVLDAYSGFQDPGHAEIDPFAMKVNRIPLASLRRKRLDRQRIRKIARRADAVIAHNASFDRSFITKHLPEFANLPWLCSQRQIPWKQFGHPSSSLSKLCEAARIPLPNHRALADCRALLEILSFRPDGKETALSMLISNLQRTESALNLGSKPAPIIKPE